MTCDDHDHDDVFSPKKELLWPAWVIHDFTRKVCDNKTAPCPKSMLYWLAYIHRNVHDGFS